jgi:hypothetical protein
MWFDEEELEGLQSRRVQSQRELSKPTSDAPQPLVPICSIRIRPIRFPIRQLSRINYPGIRG